MRKVYIMFFSLLFVAGSTFAQPVNVDIIRGTPVIDGVEEEAWDAVDPVNFELMYLTEVATVTAYWKAMWDADNIYVLINVEDDDHYPAWAVPSTATWEYDKPEIYFDVNDALIDAAGPVTPSSGHYQWSPGFAEADYDQTVTAEGTTQAPGGTYAYIRTGESYVYEHAVTISSMSNVAAEAMDCEKIKNLPEKIGFDATIIDQDQDITSARQRTVWQSKDAEAWNSMDASGTITMVGDCVPVSGIKDQNTVNVAVSPNPVTDYLTINADFDKVVINNILGQQISSLNQIRTSKLDVGYLSKGIYIIKVYKGERYIGAAKITKN